MQNFMMSLFSLRGFFLFLLTVHISFVYGGRWKTWSNREIRYQETVSPTAETYRPNLTARSYQDFGTKKRKREDTLTFACCRNQVIK
jgi:hypothetical protein